ncbi:MAG: hypothetical protein M2R45_04561 [Verrucomicrobia subdivision 3 bacterium]|nr:hypothetical protein [Limisphaerales bacterium]MCS1416800.1 hypothetical protein [Limisphaerales bacterium]
MIRLEMLSHWSVLPLAVLAGTGYWLAVRSLFPRFSKRSSQRWRKPWLNIAVGLIGVPVAWAGHSLYQAYERAVGEWFGVILLVVPMFLGWIGLTGLALRIGQGLKPAQEDHQSWLVTLRGAVVLGLVLNLPFLNYFILPVLLAGGLGAFILEVRSLKSHSGSVRGANPRATSRKVAKQEDRGNPNRKSRPPWRGRSLRSRKDRESPRGENPPD